MLLLPARRPTTNHASRAGEVGATERPVNARKVSSSDAASSSPKIALTTTRHPAQLFAPNRGSNSRISETIEWWRLLGIEHLVQRWHRPGLAAQAKGGGEPVLAIEHLQVGAQRGPTSARGRQHAARNEVAPEPRRDGVEFEIAIDEILLQLAKPLLTPKVGHNARAFGRQVRPHGDLSGQGRRPDVPGSCAVSEGAGIPPRKPAVRSPPSLRR